MNMHWGGLSLINMPFWVPSFLLLLMPFVFVFIVWSVFWKGLALWHSARRGEPWWFLAILFINTLGILEIVYLFFIAKLKIEELFLTRNHHSNH